MLELITSNNWLRWLPGQPGCCSRDILVCVWFTPWFGINYLGQIKQLLPRIISSIQSMSYGRALLTEVFEVRLEQRGLWKVSLPTGWVLRSAKPPGIRDMQINPTGRYLCALDYLTPWVNKGAPLGAGCCAKACLHGPGVLPSLEEGGRKGKQRNSLIPHPPAVGQPPPPWARRCWCPCSVPGAFPGCPCLSQAQPCAGV